MLAELWAQIEELSAAMQTAQQAEDYHAVVSFTARRRAVLDKLFALPLADAQRVHLANLVKGLIESDAEMQMRVSRSLEEAARQLDELKRRRAAGRAYQRPGKSR